MWFIFHTAISLLLLFGNFKCQEIKNGIEDSNNKRLEEVAPVSDNPVTVLTLETMRDQIIITMNEYMKEFEKQIQGNCTKQINDAEKVFGKKLKEMEKALDKKLRQLEAALMEENDVKCLMLCREWSEWSGCGKSDETEYRERKCNEKPSFPKQDRRNMTQKEERKCENFCDKKYDRTKHGYCVKVFKTLRNRENAELRCVQDGGHLVHINSQRKYNNVQHILQKEFGTVNTNILVDGIKTSLDKKWRFSCGSHKAYFHWHNGEPDSKRRPKIPMCISLSNVPSSKIWLMWDFQCAHRTYFMCEIPAKSETKPPPCAHIKLII